MNYKNVSYIFNGTSHLTFKAQTQFYYLPGVRETLASGNVGKQETFGKRGKRWRETLQKSAHANNARRTS